MYKTKVSFGVLCILLIISGRQVPCKHQDDKNVNSHKSPFGFYIRQSFFCLLHFILESVHSNEATEPLGANPNWTTKRLKVSLPLLLTAKSHYVHVFCQDSSLNRLGHWSVWIWYYTPFFQSYFPLFTPFLPEITTLSQRNSKGSDSCHFSLLTKLTGAEPFKAELNVF